MKRRLADPGLARLAAPFAAAAAGAETRPSLLPRPGRTVPAETPPSAGTAAPFTPDGDLVDLPEFSRAAASRFGGLAGAGDAAVPGSAAEPDGERAITIALSPRLMLALRLAMAAKGVPAGEIVSRGIAAYAHSILPQLGMEGGP